MTEYLLYLGGAIILGLLVVALCLHWRLYKMNKRIKLRRQEAEQQYQLARQHLNQSIQIICKALLEHQVGYAEASLRVSKLMDQLSVPEAIRQEYVAFDKLAASIDHIPILEAWTSLPKQQKKDYSQQIEQQEEAFGDFIRDAAQRLVGRTL